MEFMVRDQEMNNNPWIIVYSKDACPYCDKAKALLEKKGHEYTEIKIGQDIMREEFIFTFPGVKTVPFIIINGEHIGGYDRLTEWFSK
jgi:glutaredoxin